MESFIAPCPENGSLMLKVFLFDRFHKGLSRLLFNPFISAYHFHVALVPRSVSLRPDVERDKASLQRTF